METNILNKLSTDLRIAPEFIIREDWEMKIMEKIAGAAIGSFLVFKGGTSLRLAYNSPRFSEDLDFDINQKFDFKLFQNAIKEVVSAYPNLKQKDLAQKYNTYLAQISVSDEPLNRDFSVKIEVSTRTVRQPDYFELKMLVSPVNAAQVLFNTARLAEIKKEKLKALQTRQQARDLFDLWYLAQVSREPWQVPENDLDPKKVKQELNKYLPENYQQVIKELIV